jgi:hypothetical protein
MKYLCLIYMNEEDRDAIPAEQWEPLMQEGFDWGDERREQGVFLDGNPLQPVRTAVTVRRKRGELSFTDGPFMETKEQLAGYTLIEAPDMQAAKEIAATLPPGRIGTVEIRPLWTREELLARRVTDATAAEY